MVNLFIHCITHCNVSSNLMNMHVCSELHIIFSADFAEKVPEDVREQVLMTNLLPCVKVWCY